MLNNVTSGGATVNDAFFHAMTNASPFGGIGSSGNGNYHGYYSIKAFSHERSIARVPGWVDKLLRVRYMPYSIKELERHRGMSQKKANFDRNGDIIKGISYWLGVIFSLGGKSAQGSVLRWGFFLALTAILGLKRGSIGL